MPKSALHQYLVQLGNLQRCFATREIASCDSLVRQSAEKVVYYRLGIENRGKWWLPYLSIVLYIR